ncbi:tyrosine-type recombinase/integrase [candidate division KSB1 bacterium]|nr:tyrosine-type recombinase/integrase [candidate division KSB1 bacterium]
MNPKPKRAYIFKRPAGHYQFKIWFDNGTSRYFSKKCNQKTAQELCDKINNRIALGTFDMDDFSHSREKRYPCEKFMQEYLVYREGLVYTGRLSQNTLDKDYYSIVLWLKHFGKNKSITEITEQTVNAFIIDLKTNKKTIYGKNYTASSINGYLKHISGAFSYAVRNGYMKSNPVITVDKIPVTPAKRVYTDEEISRLREELAKSSRWKIDMFNLALWTGSRVNELLTLKAENFTSRVFQKLGTIHLLTLHGKGNKLRQIPLGPNATELLSERLFILSSPERIEMLIKRHSAKLQKLYRERAAAGYVFFEVNNKRTVSHAFKAALLKAGIRDGTFHDLRKTFATYSLEDGLTIETVSGTLGHSDISITQKSYAEKTLLKLVLESKMRTEK